MALIVSRDIPVWKIHGRFVPIVLLTVMTSNGPALHAHSDSNANSLQREGERLLEEGRTTLDANALNAAKNSFAECAHQDPRNAKCLFDLARAEFYLVKVEDIAKHSDASKKWLDTAISDAQKSIAINDHFADAHALLADLYGAKITGALSGMRFGPKANAETARAFQLDPNNALAFAVQGRKYLFAPSAFGGDIDKAIESFKHAVSIDPHSDEDFVWLAKACRKKGDSTAANNALAEALKLNSKSTFARRVQSGTE
jgi:tetratricopeptide (TPR) repeat protein